MKTMADFLAHFRRQRAWTRQVVTAVPEEHFGWAPGEDAFTCGGLVVHLMQAEIFWCRLLVKATAGEALDPFGFEGSAEDRLRQLRGPNLESSTDSRYGTSFAACLERWSEIQARTERDLGAIADDALHSVRLVHPLTTLEAPLWQMLLIFVEHEGHHRGQLTAYLKSLGVDQPAAVVGT